MSPVNALMWLLVLPLAATPLIYLGGRIAVRQGSGAAPARWLAVLAMLATGWLLYVAGQGVLAGGAVRLEVGRVALQMDGVALLLAATVLVLTFIVTIFSVPYMARETGEEK